MLADEELAVDPLLPRSYIETSCFLPFATRVDFFWWCLLRRSFDFIVDDLLPFFP